MNASTLELFTWTSTIILITLIFLLYKYFTRKFDNWKKLNIPYLSPVPFFGNLGDVVLSKRSLTDWQRDMYNSTEEPFVGVFFFAEPQLMIKSPELVKSILIRDFDHFRDRAAFSPKHDVVQANLNFWQPSELGWRQVRSKISPFFTSGRLKAMFPMMHKIGGDMVNYVNKTCEENIVEAKDFCSKYTTDVIAKCAFGIDANCFKFENAEFREVGRRMFEPTPRNIVSQISYFYFQQLAGLFKMSFYGVKNFQFLCHAIKTVINERKKSNVRCGDLIDLLIQMQKEKVKEFEGNKIYSQPIGFFIGGFETTGTTISLTLYELALNKHVQDKLRQEILEKIKNVDITYEGIMSMEYLDLCIRETLRKYPSVPFLDRKCINDYTIPGTNKNIKKGTHIYIPLIGFHYDEKYFPEPEKYIPERFEDKNLINLNGIYYFPFGEGPRSCVGERFGLLASKVALVHILSEFEVLRTQQTLDKIKFAKGSLVIQAENGIPIRLQSLKN